MQLWWVSINCRSPTCLDTNQPGKSFYLFLFALYSYISNSQVLWVQLGPHTSPSHGDRPAQPDTHSAGHRKQSTHMQCRFTLDFKASISRVSLCCMCTHVCHTWLPSSLAHTRSGLSRGGNSCCGRSHNAAHSPRQTIPWNRLQTKHATVRVWGFLFFFLNFNLWCLL